MARHVIPSRARPAGIRAHRRADDAYGVSDEPNWRSVDWGAHLHRVTVGGSEVNYVDMGSGDGPPVVLVHGLSGQWQNWLENIAPLARHRRVIALDLPGFGRSPMPHERITIPGYGRCLDELCDRLELGSVALVGNSMGGFVASEVAMRRPERVDRLILVSAAGITTANLFRAPARITARVLAVVVSTTAAQHRKLACRPGTRHAALALVVRHPGRLAPDVAWEGLMKGAGTDGFRDAMRACVEYDFRDHIGDIRCPTLVVWGENDTVLPVKDASEFERLVPGSRKVVMEDTGHMPMVERPVAFNELLLGFLSEEAKQDATQGVPAAASAV